MASTTENDETLAPQNKMPQDEAHTAGPAKSLRYIDIAINLTDSMYRGSYHGKQAHTDDVAHVIQRARDAGVAQLLVTGTDLHESRQAVDLAKQYPGYCYATIGIHPCTASVFTSPPDVDPTTHTASVIAELRALAITARDEGVACAFGECGLDYDRLTMCDRETQLHAFAQQLDLATELQMPMFLHSRAAAEDFERLLSERLDRLPRRGVVHSFTGSKDEMRRLVEMGFDIGINGCSLKTEENLVVAREVPLERLQIETDGPWCEMRPSHASAAHTALAPLLPRAVKKEKWSSEFMVKGRNEPCAVSHVAFALASIKDVPVEEVCEAAWRNSGRMFGIGEQPSADD